MSKGGKGESGLLATRRLTPEEAMLAGEHVSVLAKEKVDYPKDASPRGVARQVIELIARTYKIPLYEGYQGFSAAHTRKVKQQEGYKMTPAFCEAIEHLGGFLESQFGKEEIECKPKEIVRQMAAKEKLLDGLEGVRAEKLAARMKEAAHPMGGWNFLKVLGLKPTNYHDLLTNAVSSAIYGEDSPQEVSRVDSRASTEVESEAGSLGNLSAPPSPISTSRSSLQGRKQ